MSDRFKVAASGADFTFVRRDRGELDLFRASPRVRLGPIGEVSAERYAVIGASPRSSGEPIPSSDLWIAASAVEHATELVPSNRDVTRVAQSLVAFYES